LTKDFRGSCFLYVYGLLIYYTSRSNKMPLVQWWVELVAEK
jgi:hypothetical protein